MRNEGAVEMELSKGSRNCITDVEGVQVGHVTLQEKINDTDTICTGVSAILPHAGNLFTDKVPAASHVINGFGKTCGLVQIDELGLIESPIMLTNTFSVGPVLQGTLTYMLAEDETIGDQASSLNIVVGECNDSYLNSMRMQAIKPSHAIQAIQGASNDPVEEGAIGAGKGMVCFGYKGGIGTASRKVEHAYSSYTVGTLVLSNFGKRTEALFADWNDGDEPNGTPDGSIMMVIATDAPLTSRQLKRLAKRSAVGLGRLGSYYANGSGDIAIAFSTANRYQHESQGSTENITLIRDDHPVMNQLFQAVTECIETAVLSSLKNAETTHGRKGRTIDQAPF